MALSGNPAEAHMLIGAMKATYLPNQTLYADSDLTEQGASMSRSAARRGLVEPHPFNPEMEANTGSFAVGPAEVQMQARENARYAYSQKAQPVENWVPRAVQRQLFRGRAKPMTGEQQTLF